MNHTNYQSLLTITCVYCHVSSLIQAQLGSIPIQEFGLNQDTVKIFRNGMRISRCVYGSHQGEQLNKVLPDFCFFFDFDYNLIPIRPDRVSAATIKDWIFCSAQLPDPG